VAVIIVAITTYQRHVVEHDAVDVRADVEELLFGAADYCARTLAAVNHQHHAVNHRRENRGIRKRDRGWRVNDDMREALAHFVDEFAHFIGAEKFSRIRRDWPRGHDL